MKELEILKSKYKAKEACIRLQMLMEANKYSTADFINAIDCSHKLNKPRQFDKYIIQELLLTKPEYIYVCQNKKIRDIISSQLSSPNFEIYPQFDTPEGYYYVGSFRENRYNGLLLLIYVGYDRLNQSPVAGDQMLAAF